jgi:hypothetical protein
MLYRYKAAYIERYERFDAKDYRLAMIAYATSAQASSKPVKFEKFLYPFGKSKTRSQTPHEALEIANGIFGGMRKKMGLDD